MGFWDKLKGGLGKVADFAGNAYGKYRDIKDTYHDLVPKQARRAMSDAAGWAGGRAIGGLANMVRGRRGDDDEQESLSEHLRNANYQRQERKQYRREIQGDYGGRGRSRRSSRYDRY
jgi:hypothetical protein